MTEGSIIPLFCIPVTGAQSSALSLPKLSLEFLFAVFINLIKCLFKKKIAWENRIPKEDVWGFSPADQQQAKILSATRFNGFNWFICSPNIFCS